MNRKFLRSKFKDMLKTDKLKKQVWENTSVITPNSNSFSKKYFYAKKAKPSSCSIVELYTHMHTHTHTWGQEDSLEKEMTTHSSIHAWRIPWTEEPGGLQSMGSQSQTQLSN